ncbi:uncharacterized protein TNCV_1147071 [Trichonephila clavipes]|nr:uncharacterized protein TNCV_1147071 [Trichonephila clavipes]
MRRKGLTIPEAFEVFHNLPSDIESDESSIGEAENVMIAKSSCDVPPLGRTSLEVSAFGWKRVAINSVPKNPKDMLKKRRVSPSQSSRENTDIDEEKYDISVPGPSRIFKVTWKNKASVKI